MNPSNSRNLVTFGESVPPPVDLCAGSEYSLDRVSAGSVSQPQYLLVLRRQSGKASQVLMTTTDIERIGQTEQRVRQALAVMTVAQFETFIGMRRTVRAVDVTPLPS